MIPLWPIELLELKRLTKTMNFATKTISVLMSRVWLIAVLMYGFTAVSCSGDDNGPKHDGKYIVTNPVEIIGMTYATLSGEYYPDNLPQAYANGMPMQFGVLSFQHHHASRPTTACRAMSTICRVVTLQPLPLDLFLAPSITHVHF